MNKLQIVKFTVNDFELDVRADSENETVWLSVDEMSTLFERDRTVISRHIINVFNEKELDKKATCIFCTFLYQISLLNFMTRFNQRKTLNTWYQGQSTYMVVQAGNDPATRGFSVLCSTN